MPPTYEQPASLASRSGNPPLSTSARSGAAARARCRGRRDPGGNGLIGLVLAGIRAFVLLAVSATAIAATGAAGAAAEQPAGGTESAWLPTGASITPLAAPGSRLLLLNPGLADRPGFLADHAVANALSPDGRTLLVLTSGYNRNFDAAGKLIHVRSASRLGVRDFGVNRARIEDIRGRFGAGS
jgi:hypothetical protein